jgi:hypothetical protein
MYNWKDNAWVAYRNNFAAWAYNKSQNKLSETVERM